MFALGVAGGVQETHQCTHFFNKLQDMTHSMLKVSKELRPNLLWFDMLFQCQSCMQNAFVDSDDAYADVGWLLGDWLRVIFKSFSITKFVEHA